MVSPPLSSPTVSSGVCTFCGLGYMGRPNQCTRCGALLNDAAGDAKRIGKENRRHTHNRRALADLLFLVGLLLGGPMMTIGGDVRTGLFIVLAGLQGIAHPADGVVEFARYCGREVKVMASCCSVVTRRRLLSMSRT